jgi:hypothetical protein
MFKKNIYLKYVLILSTLILIIFFWGKSFAEGNKNEIKITPLPLKAVEVYLKNALFSHEIEVKLNEGDTILHFGEVAEKLDTSKIWIQGIENQNIKIVKKEFKNFLDINPKQEALYKAYQDSLEIIKDSLAKFKTEIDAITKTQEIILNTKNTLSQDNLSVDKLKELNKFFRQYYADTQKEQKEWQKKIKNAEKKNIDFEKKLTKIKQIPSQRIPQLILHIQVLKKVEGSLTIEYLANSAYWQGIYDFKLGEKDTLLKVMQKAILTQNSGINWKKIQLSLASRHNKSNDKVISFPPKPQTFNLKYDSILDTSQKKSNLIEKEVIFVQKSWKEPFDLKSGENTTLIWEEKNLNFDKNNMAWLSVDNHIYKTITPKKWENNGFPAKIAQMNYLDKNPINLDIENLQKDNFSIPLEIVAQIKTNIEIKNIEEKNNSKKWRLDFEVRSLRNDTLDVVFEEFIPISLHKDLVIEVKNITNNPEKIAQKIRWKMKLLPQEKKQWSLEYEAKFPEKMKIQ